MVPHLTTTAGPMPWGTLLLALWPLWFALGALAVLRAFDWWCDR